MWEYNVYGIENRYSNTSQLCDKTMCMALTTNTEIARKYVRIQCVWHWQQRLRYLANMWEYNVYGIDNRDSDTSQKCENTMCMALTTEIQIPRKYVTRTCVWHWQQRLRYIANMWESNVYGIDKRASDASQKCEITMCVALTKETQIPRKDVRCVSHWETALRYLQNLWEYTVRGIDNKDSDTSQICENTMCMALTTETQIPRKYVKMPRV